MKYYAGIGSRETPKYILVWMTDIACALERSGYILRSGGAIGADKAFEDGVTDNSHKEIFRPHHATKAAIDLAMKIHPAPHNCNSYVKKLHGRNAQIMLGKNLDIPSEFTICWTKNGKVVGGTGLGINLSIANNIEVYNLYLQKDIERLIEKLPILKDIFYESR